METVLYGPRRLPWRDIVSKFAVASHDDGALLISPPSFDPRVGRGTHLPPGITPELYQVPSTGLTREERDRALTETRTTLQEGARHMLGFMGSTNFQSSCLVGDEIIGLTANIAGDPFQIETFYKHMPKWIETCVLDYFASLWNAKWPHNSHDPESYWGYILTMGSSEGNLHALWNARNYLTYDQSPAFLGAKIVPEPVLIFSQNSNFSIKKLADMVKVRPFYEVGREAYPQQNPVGGDWTEGVPCTGGDTGPGTIDIDSLTKVVDFFSARHHPIIVIFNYGTSLKGGCDDVQTAGERLVRILKKNDMYERRVCNPQDPSKSIVRKKFWFHVDGALSAAYMPFLDMAYKNGLTQVKPASIFDFRLDFISSIVVSGHKYIGTPWPCGVYLTRNKLLCSKSNHIHVIGSTDTTVCLSRNAHSAILLWSFISSHSYDKQVEDIVHCQGLVQYTVKKLKELEKQYGVDLFIIHFLPSLSVLFKKPSNELITKYSLSLTNLEVGADNVAFAQLYIMRHVTTRLIDSFIVDLEWDLCNLQELSLKECTNSC